MSFTPVHNPNPAQITAMLTASNHRALRRIPDQEGGYWYWPFEQATHAEGARLLNVLYDRTPGAGDVVFGD